MYNNILGACTVAIWYRFLHLTHHLSSLRNFYQRICFVLVLLIVSYISHVKHPVKMVLSRNPRSLLLKLGSHVVSFKRYIPKCNL
jgi:hypothetical protein